MMGLSGQRTIYTRACARAKHLSARTRLVKALQRQPVAVRMCGMHCQAAMSYGLECLNKILTGPPELAGGCRPWRACRTASPPHTRSVFGWHSELC